MRLRRGLGIIALFLLLGIPAQAQLRDLPSQAEFDPILENAEKKLKDFVATLTEFRAEAAAIDPERLATDLRSVQQLQEMIQSAHTGTVKKNGINLQRLVAILAGLDDMALDAGIWKSLAELHMCQQLVQRMDSGRSSQFGVRVSMNAEMLREVSGQLFHPTLRMASAADEILQAISDVPSKVKPKPH